MSGRYPAVLAIALCTALAAPAVSRAAESAPAELRPADAKLLFTAKATGVQIYDSVTDASGALKWVLEAPLARLAGPRGVGVLYHYAGPSWEAADGSKIVRDTDVPVKSVPAPRASIDIPWLLVKVTADPAPGVLSNVTYVERLVTHGGAAPAAPPKRPDTKVGVPYTATYAFLVKAD